MHAPAPARTEAHVLGMTKAINMKPRAKEPLQHYSVPYVAHMLAISERAAWNLIQAGHLKPTRYGRSTRVMRREVERFIEEHSG